MNKKKNFSTFWTALLLQQTDTKYKDSSSLILIKGLEEENEKKEKLPQKKLGWLDFYSNLSYLVQLD